MSEHVNYRKKDIKLAVFVFWYFNIALESAFKLKMVRQDETLSGTNCSNINESYKIVVW